MIAAYIARLRKVLADEAPTQPTVHSSVTLREEDGTPVVDEPGIGRPLSARMHRYIGHPDHWGASRLGMASILEVSDRCAARHPSHRIPGRSRSLCAQLLFEVGYLGQDIEDVAWLHGFSIEQAERMLLASLRHAEQWREERERSPRLEADFDGPEPVPYQPLRRPAA